MALSDSGQQQSWQHTTRVRVEVIILFIGVVANMTTAFLAATWGDFDVPYFGEYIDVYVTLQGLYIALILEGVIIALASAGLMYKSIKIVYDLQQSKREVRDLSELEEVREMFIHMAQHRLKTPLSGIRWALGIIKSSQRLNEEEHDLIEKSTEKINDANDLIEKLLKMHQSDLSSFELSQKKDQIDIAQLLKEIVDDLDYLAQEKNTKVDCKCSSSSIIIAGEKHVLTSALTNIIDNAIRYTPHGQVTVMAKTAEDGVKIIIADNGIGISTIEQKHIFERHYRGKNARAIDRHQSGIGLYLAQQVIGLHGGHIELSSVETEGTTFTITLPQE
ncbi:MAG: HAMP domain-containing sensor histidine kinase [Candidatus Paceibacterota bacterium]